MRFLLVTITVTLFSVFTYAQSSFNWSTSLSENRCFIENQGQFDRFQTEETPILFALDGGSTMVFFTNQGYIIQFSGKVKNKNRQRGDRSKARYLEETETISVNFSGSLDNVEVKAEQKVAHSFTYAMLHADKSQTHVEQIDGYEQLVYKNIYPNIDAVFTIHEVEGFKYDLILHSEANTSDIQMEYPLNQKLKIDSQGNLIIGTSFGDIVDHAPKTYYAATQSSIESTFKINENTVSFSVGEYDSDEEIVIDPWVVTPAFPNSGGIWDIDVDDLGNVYIYGGDTPMKLQKYDPAGALQWTYNTPWDSANYWIGTMLTEPTTGDCFITAGTDPVVSRVSTAGSPMWTANGGAFDEYWKLSLNCDNSRLFLGGTRLTLGGAIIEGYGYVFEIDMSNGSQLNNVEVASVTPGPLGLVSNPNEVRAMCPSPNGNYYYMTLDTIGRFDETLTLGYQDNHGYGFSYQVAGYGVTNQSINAMAATTDYIYTTNGSVLDKRNIVNGSVIASVAIPNGNTSNELGFNSAENGGLVLDSCGNVYTGSSTGVYKYDEDLNQLAFEATPAPVYDVAVNSAGEVVACGQGFAASLALQPCAPPKAICLNCLELTPAGPYCQTDLADTLMAEPGNGLWTGPGIIDPILGIFDPSVADTGSHVIHFLPEIPLECGIDSMVIRVNFCTELVACFNGSGDITVLNGVAPYTWSHTVDTLDCSTCFPGIPPFIQPCSTPPSCAVQTTMVLEFATDTTVTPTGNWPLFVEDSQGNILEIGAMSELSPCESGCFISVNLPDTVVACQGDSAFATALVTGAIGNVVYSWSTTPAQTTQTAIDLAPGSYYWVTVTDDSLCTAIDSVYVMEQECTGPTACATPFGDIQAEGFGPFTWLQFVESSDCSTCLEIPGFPPCSFPPGCEIITQEWEQFATTEIITPTGNWPLALVDGVGDSLFINSLAELAPCPQSCYIEVDVPAQITVCFGQSDGEAMATVNGAIGAVTYSWNTTPGQSSQTATNLSVGEYVVTVVDANNCEATDTVEVVMTPEITLIIQHTDSLCVGDNGGTATVTPSGGVGGYAYSWNTSPTQNVATANNLSSGSYEVTVTDQAMCEASVSIDIASYPPVLVNAEANDTICIGDESFLSVSGGVSYLWNSGETSAQITVSPDSTAEYTVLVTDANGCSNSDTVLVWVTPLPVINWGEIYPVYCIEEPPFQLYATPSGGEFFGPGVTSSGWFDPVAAGPGIHEYFYNYGEVDECYGSGATLITIDEFACAITQPNVFNPGTNYVGQVDFCGNVPQNNVFNLTCLELHPGNRVRIYDRWGRKCYDQIDYHLKPWDGDNQSDGVFYYVLELLDDEPVKGFFHLVR